MQKSRQAPVFRSARPWKHTLVVACTFPACGFDVRGDSDLSRRNSIGQQSKWPMCHFVTSANDLPIHTMVVKESAPLVLLVQQFFAPPDFVPSTHLPSTIYSRSYNALTRRCSHHGLSSLRVSCCLPS